MPCRHSRARMILAHPFRLAKQEELQVELEASKNKKQNHALLCSPAVSLVLDFLDGVLGPLDGVC